MATRSYGHRKAEHQQYHLTLKYVKINREVVGCPKFSQHHNSTRVKSSILVVLPIFNAKSQAILASNSGVLIELWGIEIEQVSEIARSLSSCFNRALGD